MRTTLSVLLLTLANWLACQAGIQAVKPGFVFPNDLPMFVMGTLNRSTSSVSIGTANAKVGWVFQAPKTGDLHKWCFGTYTVVTGATMDVRAETVDVATGYPTGTLWASSTNGAQVIADSDDNVWFCTAFTADASVTRGQYIAMVVANPGSSYGNMIIPVFGDDYTQTPYMCKHDGSTWTTKYGSGNIGAAEYADGSYEPVWGMLPAKSVGSVLYNSGSTTKIRGLRFKLPFPTRISGVSFNTDTSPHGDFLVQLYASDGVTVLTSTTVVARETSYDAHGATVFLVRAIFDATADLVKDVYYRVGVKPTSTTDVRLTYLDVQTAATMDGLSGGQDFHYTTSDVAVPTGEGDWTQTTTRRPFLFLMFNAFDDGAGGSCGEKACVSP